MKKFRKEKQRNIKGITLISLVITIIILIILAGISINLVLGENGLFNRAKQAKEEYINAQIAEQEGINNLEKQIEELNKGLPQNTPETEAGTEVQLPSKWLTTTSGYVETEKGEIVKKEVVASNVKAISTGNGDIVPVPKGFFYVGGTVSSGVVISDNEGDKNKYAGQANVPAGAIYNEDGSAKRIVYDDEGKVTIDEFEEEEKNTAILGNQFVWIPVTEDEYKKVNWNNVSSKDYDNAIWETQTNSAELVQISKYGGFYVGRYEAGTSEITISIGSTTVDFSTKNTASGWLNDNFSIRDGKATATGNITCKAGEIPYYHADYFTSLKLSNNMYNTEYVRSGLITGTMWDAIMNFIAGEDEDKSVVTTASTWGNYNNNTTITYESNRGRYAGVDSNNGAMTTAFKVSEDADYHYGIRTTASTEGVKQKNLYDIAGNLWEWTQEASYPNNTLESYMLRGGSFTTTYSAYPACYRGYRTATGADTNIGFRPVLYIM